LYFDLDIKKVFFQIQNVYFVKIKIPSNT